MGNKLVLSNANIINDTIDDTNSNSVKISYDMTGYSPTAFNKVAEAGNNSFRRLNISEMFKKPNLKVLSSKFRYLGIVIKAVVLLTLLFIYSIIGATAVILYVIFYEKIYEKLFNKWRKENHNSTCDYNWENHQLNLN